MVKVLSAIPFKISLNWSHGGHFTLMMLGFLESFSKNLILMYKRVSLTFRRASNWNFEFLLFHKFLFRDSIQKNLKKFDYHMGIVLICYGSATHTFKHIHQTLNSCSTLYLYQQIDRLQRKCIQSMLLCLKIKCCWNWLIASGSFPNYIAEIPKHRTQRFFLLKNVPLTLT